MASIHDKEFDKLTKTYAEARPVLMAQAATMAITFFKENFRRQGFLDQTLTPWKKRISPGNGHPIGIERGTMRRGIIRKTVTGYKAVVGMDQAIKYAEIHNSGGQIPITNKMRRFFWAMYYKYAGQVTSSVKTKKENNTKRNKVLNELAAFWMGMALTKKTHIDIPKMQFIGDSKTLEGQITKVFEQELFKIFTQ